MLQTYQRKIITQKGGPTFRVFNERYGNDSRSGMTWSGMQCMIDERSWSGKSELVRRLEHSLTGRNLDGEAITFADSLLLASDDDRKAAKSLFEKVYEYATRATGNPRKRALEGHELYRFPSEAFELAAELAALEPQAFRDELPTPRFFSRKEQKVLVQAFAFIAEDAANEQTRNLMGAIGAADFRDISYVLMREDIERVIALFRTGAVPEEALARILAFDISGQKRIVDAIRGGAGHMHMGYSDVLFKYKQTGVISNEEYAELSRI